MDLRNKLILEVNKLNIYFPKLKLLQNKQHHYLNGTIDILDTKYIYWDSFNVLITIPENYPYGVPILVLKSSKNIWLEERHISQEGVCCVDIDHELVFASKRGIRMIEFIRQWVYPFLANQLFYEREKSFAKDEYPHKFQGIKHFYSTKFGLTDPHIISLILKNIINNLIPQNNDLCICGSGRKFKYCHKETVEYLKVVGKDSAKKDLIEFNKLLNDEQK